MEEMNEILKEIALSLYDELARVGQKSQKNILYENSNNNENWHSRILRMLLEYRDDESYPFLDSFIKLINKKLKNKKANLSIEPTNRDGCVAKVLCYNEWEHIDTLVKINNDVIIIENKIHWAIDQYKQIERYIETVKLDSSVNNIYVVYLTSDGKKQVESYSYTEKAKEQLGEHNFICLNYKEDIFTWLKNIMLGIEPKDKILYSSILLYANFIEDMFKQEKNQITNKMINEMEKNKIDTSSLENCFKLVSGTSTLLEELNKEKEKRIIECARTCVEYPLRVFLKERLDNNLNLVKAEFNLGFFSIEIQYPKWKKCYIHLGVWQYKNYGGLAYFDPNNPLDQETIDKIKDKFNDWKGDKNEPFWKYFDNVYKDYYSLESWKKIENGDFENYIEGFIKEIYEKVKDCKL